MIAHVLIRAELPRFPFFDVSKVSSKILWHFLLGGVAVAPIY